MTDSTDRLEKAKQIYNNLLAEHGSQKVALASLMYRDTEVEREVEAEGFADRFGGDYSEALHNICWQKAGDQQGTP